MAGIGWSEDLAIGVAAIDGAHRELVESLAEANSAFDSGDVRAALRLLRRFLSAFANHFAVEQRILAAAGSDAVAARDREWRTSQFVFAAHPLEADDVEVLGQLLNCANAWLVDHILCQDALTNEKLWPYPWLDELVMAGLVVDRAGVRVVDEGRGGVHVTNRIAKLDDPLGTTVIFDRPIWNGPGTESIIPANPHLPRVGGTIVEADTLEGLAEKLGIPADRLEATVAAYNAAVDAGDTAGLTPPRSTGRARPFPVRQGPFMAIRLVAGMTYTMGGIAIDDHGRVRREDGTPIGGLFAAGATTGGLEGGDAIGYVGGLTKSSVTGLRAAEAAAAELGRAGSDGSGVGR